MSRVPRSEPQASAAEARGTAAGMASAPDPRSEPQASAAEARGTAAGMASAPDPRSEPQASAAEARFLVISSDCHAGLPPERYRDYLDVKYRDAFDAALPIQIEMTKAAERQFLVADINAEWRRGREEMLTGAWDHDARIRVLDGDGIAGEILFPDGITEMNSPPIDRKSVV